MAIWKVHRAGPHATLVYMNTIDNRSYTCGTVSDVDTQGLLEWTIDIGQPCWGGDIFVDGSRVHCFLARPRGRAS